MTRTKRISAGMLLAAIVSGVAAALFYQPATSDPIPIKVDPKIYDAYAGYYFFDQDDLLTLRRDGDRLMCASAGYLTDELFPETESRFFFKGDPARVTFHKDDQGQVDSLTFSQSPATGAFKAVRRTELPPAPEGTQGMIAATTGGAATQAGLQVLKDGGSAMDAAMSTALAQVVQSAGSYVSFAGPLILVYYDAATDKVYCLNAQYNTPLEEKDPRSIPNTGGRTALVPGFMAGVQAAHDRFGKLPRERVFEPAIALAEKGQAVSATLSSFIETKKSVLSRLSETKRIFTTGDGTFYAQGDLFRQTELADTLKQVAAQGASYMYDGPWGRKFVEVIQKHGGKIRQQDMQKYRAFWEEPVQTTYRDYRVFAPGVSAWGGVDIAEGLNLLELADLKQSGHYTTSPRSLLWFMEIAACHNLTWGWRNIAGRDLAPKSRVTKETSAWIWEQMQNGNWPYLTQSMKRTGGAAHSDGVVVVDQWGNVAAVGHTINTVVWGDTGVFVDGVSIPDSAAFQGEHIARAGPGKRLPNGMSPLIVFRAGKPLLGSAAVGGALHHKTLQVLANILDFGMDPQTAVDAPAFVLHTWDYNAAIGQVEKGTFDPELLEGVKKLGMKIKIAEVEELGMVRGYWTGVQIDPQTGRKKGGVSRSLEGEVVGY